MFKLEEFDYIILNGVDTLCILNKQNDKEVAIYMECADINNESYYALRKKDSNIEVKEVSYQEYKKYTELVDMATKIGKELLKDMNRGASKCFLCDKYGLSVDQMYSALHIYKQISLN